MEVRYVRDRREEDSEHVGGNCRPEADRITPLGYGVRHCAQRLQLQGYTREIERLVRPGTPSWRTGFLFGTDRLRSGERGSRRLGARQNEASEGNGSQPTAEGKRGSQGKGDR